MAEDKRGGWPVAGKSRWMGNRRECPVGDSTCLLASPRLEPDTAADTSLL